MRRFWESAADCPLSAAGSSRFQIVVQSCLTAVRVQAGQGAQENQTLWQYRIRQLNRQLQSDRSRRRYLSRSHPLFTDAQNLADLSTDGLHLNFKYLVWRSALQTYYSQLELEPRTLRVGYGNWVPRHFMINKERQRTQRNDCMDTKAFKRSLQHSENYHRKGLVGKPKLPVCYSQSIRAI